MNTTTPTHWINTFKLWEAYLLITALTLLLIFFSSNVIINDNLLYDAYEGLSFSQIEKMIDFNKEWSWIGYAITPIILILKYLAIASVLYGGIYLVFDEREFSFSLIIKSVILADVVFWIANASKMAYFYYQSSYSLQDINYYFPLSLTQLFEADEVNTYLYYLLQSSNLFELVYWFVLAWIISRVADIDFDKSFNNVMLAYLPAFIIWVVFVTFISIMYS